MANKPDIMKSIIDSGSTTTGGKSSGGGSGGGYSTIQYGSSGENVKTLQQTLNRLGYNVGAADGIFGNNTKNAVLQYQRDNGLTADGIVGANTWGALNTPVTPKSTPSVDYAGIIAELDKQQAGFQNAAAPTAAAQRVQTATGGTVKASPGELRAEAQAPTVTAKTETALAEKTGKTAASKAQPASAPAVDYAGIIAQYAGTPVMSQNAAAPTAAAAKTQEPESPATEPDEERGKSPTPTPTAPTTTQQISTPTVPTTTATQQPTAARADTPPIDYSAVLREYAPQEETVTQYDTPSVLDAAPSGYTAPERNPYYEPNYQRILQEMENYPAFSYDKNADPLWASVAKQYRREGQRATQDTLGQYAAMTGGIPSTAAVTAASQAGDYYGAQLADRLQDVYNSAYQRYLDQYTRMMGLADQYRSGMDFEEGQFTGDRNFGFNQYTDSRNFDYDKYLNERNFQYQQEQDSYSRGKNAMEDAQNRVAVYLSMGGDPANLDAEIVRQSGYSTAEMQQMRDYYAQQAALQAARASGGGSSGGGSSGGRSGGSGGESGSVEEAAGYESVDVTSLSKDAQNSIVSSLKAMFPGGVIDTDDWRVVTQEFDPQWLAANGFTERGMTGEYRAEAEQPTVGYNVGTAIEKAVSNYGAAKDFLTRNGASQSVINGLMKQSSLGLSNDDYKQYLRDYIEGFLNGFTTPSYNQTVNDLATQNPQVSGNVLSMLYVPTR